MLFSHASPSLSLDPIARYCWRPEHVKNKVIVSNKDQNKQTFQVSSPSPIHLSPSPYSLLYRREQSATRDKGSCCVDCPFQEDLSSLVYYACLYCFVLISLNLLLYFYVWYFFRTYLKQFIRSPWKHWPVSLNSRGGIFSLEKGVWCYHQVLSIEAQKKVKNRSFPPCPQLVSLW